MTSTNKAKHEPSRKSPPESDLITATDPTGVTFRCDKAAYRHASRETGRGTTVERIRATVENAEVIYEGHAPQSRVHQKRLPPAADLSSTQRYFLVISRNEARHGVQLATDTAYAAPKPYGTRMTHEGKHPKAIWKSKSSQA